MTDEREDQVIEESDVGSADEILDLGEEAVEPSESVPEDEVEEVADEVEIPTGKLEGALKKKFITLYNLIAPLGNVTDHSPTSRRIHFKVAKTDKHGKVGLALLFYSRTPTLWINYDDDIGNGNGKKKRRLEKYVVTVKSITDTKGQTITQKQVVSAINAFKRGRGL